MALKRFFNIVILIVFSIVLSLPATSQEEPKNHFSAGADFFSSYIWRGTRYGTGPHIQPSVEFNAGPFTAGGWGSFNFNGYEEADLYLSFKLPAGFSIGITDYYYPGLDYFDYTRVSGSHAFELNGGFSKWGLSISANYIVNQSGGAGSAGGDKYFEAGYGFKTFNLFIGAGDGWHSADNNSFRICNVGLGTSRVIKITDTFSIPLTGQIIFNPDRETMFIVVGFSL
jgi:hypothetical protein